MATMKTIEAMPQEMPNMVSILRSLCAQMFRSRLGQDFARQTHGKTSLSPSFKPFRQPRCAGRWRCQS